jgi:hypothetical protein
MITPRAKDRCEARSPQEQLEDCRRAMQRESGSDDMGAIDLSLNHEAWVRLTPGGHMPLGGAD